MKTSYAQKTTQSNYALITPKEMKKAGKTDNNLIDLLNSSRTQEMPQQQNEQRSNFMTKCFERTQALYGEISCQQPDTIITYSSQQSLIHSQESLQRDETTKKQFIVAQPFKFIQNFQASNNLQVPNKPTQYCQLACKDLPQDTSICLSTGMGPVDEDLSLQIDKFKLDVDTTSVEKFTIMDTSISMPSVASEFNSKEGTQSYLNKQVIPETVKIQQGPEKQKLYKITPVIPNRQQQISQVTESSQLDWEDSKKIQSHFNKQSRLVRAQAFDPYNYFGAIEMTAMPDEDFGVKGLPIFDQQTHPQIKQLFDAILPIALPVKQKVEPVKKSRAISASYTKQNNTLKATLTSKNSRNKTLLGHKSQENMKPVITKIGQAKGSIATISQQGSIKSLSHLLNGKNGGLSSASTSGKTTASKQSSFAKLAQKVRLNFNGTIPLSARTMNTQQR